MRSLLIFIAVLLLSQPILAQEKDCPQQHDKPVVLFISPSSVEIDSLKQELGDDFYTAADDAMYYRSQAFSILEENNLEYQTTECEEQKFWLNGKYQQIEMGDPKSEWYAILWNGKEKPIIVSPVELLAGNEYLGIKN